MPIFMFPPPGKMPDYDFLAVFFGYMRCSLGSELIIAKLESIFNSSSIKSGVSLAKCRCAYIFKILKFEEGKRLP